MLTFQQLGKHGQLGNQLFQYALLLAVSEKTGYPFGVPYQNKSTNNYQHFAMPDGFPNLTAIDSSNYTGTKHNYVECDDDCWRYCPDVFSVTDDTNFAGYFQTEKYFAPYRERLLKEFAGLPIHRDRAHALLTQLRRNGSVVFVHVRRGDALNNTKLIQPTAAFYARAALHFPGANFVVLTDDKAWCRRYLYLPNFTFSPFTDKFDDLELMRAADGGIICSSTFSWWGAWLGYTTRKIVGPIRWTVRHQCDDVLPANWIGE